MTPLLLPSVPESVSRAVVAAESAARRAGLGEEGVIRVGLAVAEAVANAVEHGNAGDAAREVYVALRETTGRLEVSVRDDGEGVAPEALRNAELPMDPLRPNGRGLYLIRELADEADAARGRVTMAFVARAGG